MDILRELHGIIRWLVAIALIVAIGIALAGTFQNRWSKWQTRVNRSIVLILALQLLLGAVLLVRSGVQVGWELMPMRLQYEHALTMLIAVGVSHLLLRFERIENVRGRLVRTLGVLCIVSLLIFAGVARLRGAAYWLPF